MDKDEMKNRISMALKDPILQQGFEIISKENALLKGRTEEFEKQILGLLYKYESVYKRFPDLKSAMDKAEAILKENAELNDYNKKLLQSDIDKHNKIVLLSQKVNDLQKENEELRNNGFTVSAMTEQQLKVALEKGEQLEKENTELKGKYVKECEDVNYVVTNYNKQLTKAKKILQKVVTDFHNMDCVTVHIDKTIAEAEQFIKDSEVEK